ncbi:MAG: GreA/GreB family elongation factor [Opitutaceae bacterium]|nr:GreA/GreB family elongation factor [Opitutaceae bacterium]MBP9913032.1 GreA/GreB family elongation factor [Opitutaceae bacterium]
MSKAFTKEDDTGDEPVLPRPVSLLPPGAKNYLTAGGAQQLRSELTRLMEDVRPPLLARPDDKEAKRELQILDQRLLYLQESLRTAEIIPPAPPPHQVVRFGATVTVREPGGAQSVYRIVGVDETDFERGWVSWLSPLARALLNAQLGQRVSFKTPRGLSELEIIGIGYE